MVIDFNSLTVSVMASSSSSSPRNINKYDVFVSFRGEDTRDNFTSHLYSALSQKSITFIDDQLNRGNEISESLVNAIEASSISVIIFSEGYASSKWCLDELLKILGCMHNHGQIVIPVFYRVDPSDVRNQRGTFGDSFSKLEERFQENSAKLQAWRNALKEAADLSGFHSQKIRPESELVKKVVNHILNRLAEVFPPNSKNQLVGVESRVEEIESHLGAESKHVLTLGIWGIGGIGKTTIARAIFQKISKNFEGSCFLENVREESQRPGGLACLQQKLLSKLFQDENLIHDIDLKFRILKRRKVLVVLDDVTSFKQMKSLIRSPDCFMPKSRIIITTRDQQVLKNWGEKEKNIYEMRALQYDHALELFCRHAFKQNHPDVGYWDLSSKVMKFAQGVPLALEVLGAFLFEREKEVWESAIKKLEIVPHKEIQEVLKISYDGLDDYEQIIFLDIACFFEGEYKDQVKSFLDACSLHAEIGLRILVDKSLITISYNEIRMHDLLRDMGREIVRQESIGNPGKRSRLWNYRDIYEVLTKNSGTEAVKGISLDMSKVNREIHMNFDAFSKMPKLRFLKFYGENKCVVSHLEGVSFAELRYFEWLQCPLKTLNIHVENLVSLKMHCSKVEQLWDGVQDLVNLKEIDLRGSESLTKLPDFSRAQNLEILMLRGCLSLMETHSSIQYLNKLKALDLKNCKNLTRLPIGIHSKYLKEFKLSGCSNLRNFPEISSSYICILKLRKVGIKELPSSIVCPSNLHALYIENCLMLESISSSIFNLQSLERIQICSCSNLKSFLEIPSCKADGSTGIEGLASFKLRLENCSSLESLPSSLCMFESLRSLKIIDCIKLQRFPDNLGNLKALKKLTVEGTAIRELPESLGQLSSLYHLKLSNNNLKRIPEGFDQLSSLEYLELFENNLDRIPEYLRSFPTSIPSKLIGLSLCVHLRNCFMLHPNELSEIVKYGWMKQIFHGERLNGRWISRSMYFPGNQIPRWFWYQSIGSSITLKTPPPVFFNNKQIMGFAFCAIVAFSASECCRHQSVEGCYVNCHLKYKSKGHEDYLLGRIRYVKSDYVFLGSYLFKKGMLDFKRLGSDLFVGRIGDVKDISFHIECSYGQCRGCCEVKKCGIHFVYAQDPPESTEEEEEEEESTEEEEEEEEPHPKRLKYFSTPSRLITS